MLQPLLICGGRLLALALLKLPDGDAVAHRLLQGDVLGQATGRAISRLICPLSF